MEGMNFRRNFLLYSCLLMCLWGPTKSENGMPVSLDDNKISEGILGPVDSKEQKPEGHESSEDKFKPRDPNGDAEDNSLGLFQAQSAGDTGGGDRMAVNEQSEMAAQSVADQGLICYDIQCNGAGCVTEAIIRAGIDVTKCVAMGDNVCRVVEEQQGAGISLTAECGPPCTQDVIQPTDPPVEVTTEAIESTTWSEWGRMPKKRRKRSSGPRVECCTQNLCNHDSPCGSLTCAADAPSFTKFLIFVVIAIFASLYFY